jgi:survival-of-motor-neuron-related-splicing factor 30
MATASSTVELKDTLAQYEAQYDQVVAALTNDPENDELLKLKDDLMDVIKLTKDLIELAPQKKKKVSSEWKQGDSCKAIWSKNGKYI